MAAIISGESVYDKLSVDMIGGYAAF
ncbi:Protein of unknown function [Bacillus cereus]|nr:Protein of unknown function [Bacillus cereus]